MEELIRPNWHIAMIHFPIALLVIGAMVELFSFFGWRKSTFRIFGRWAILLGAIIAVPTTFSGLYALTDVVPGGLSALEKTDPVAAEVIWDHLWMNAVATAAAMLLVVKWIAFSDVWRDRLSIVFKIFLLLIVALVIIGAKHGGEIVYAHHVGLEKNPPATFPTSLPDMPVDQLIDEAFKTEQMHVVIAGFAAAMACVCLGLSIRAIAQPDDLRAYEDAASTHRIAAAFSSGIPAMNDNRNVDPRMLLLERPTDSINHTPPIRTGRFWLLGVLLLITASASGLLVLAVDQGTWDYDALRNAITKPIEETDPQLTRRYAHVIVGLVLVGDSILLAFASMVARRNKLLLVILSIPMIAALAIQIWLGVLLILEGPSGAVTGFLHAI